MCRNCQGSVSRWPEFPQAIGDRKLSQWSGRRYVGLWRKVRSRGTKVDYLLRYMENGVTVVIVRWGERRRGRDNDYTRTILLDLAHFLNLALITSL